MCRGLEVHITHCVHCRSEHKLQLLYLQFIATVLTVYLLWIKCLQCRVTGSSCAHEVEVPPVRPARKQLSQMQVQSERAQALPRRQRKNWTRSEEHTSELQSRGHLVCRLL